jgi:hypothetical protein
MTRNLQRRLQKLESQVPRQPTEQEKDVQSFQNFLMFAVAYYLGDPRPEEAPITAYGRALGYPNSHEFQKAWDANDPDLYERDRLARIKLLAKFGVSREHDRKRLLKPSSAWKLAFPSSIKRAAANKITQAVIMQFSGVTLPEVRCVV